jgi:hypothetical protein
MVQARTSTIKVDLDMYAQFRANVAAARMTPGSALGHGVSALASSPGALSALGELDSGGSGHRVPRVVAPVAGDADWLGFLAEAAGAGMTRSAALAVLVHSVAAGRVGVEVRVTLPASVRLPTPTDGQ